MSESTIHRFLRRLKLGKVALVPRGANPGAHIAIAKNSQLSDQVFTVPPTSADEETDVDLTKIAEALGLDKDSDEEAVLAELGKRHDLTEVGKALKLEGDDVTPERVVKAIEEIEGDDGGDGGDGDDGDEDGGDGEQEAAALASKLAKAEERADEQAEEIQKLRKAERTRTFVAKAEEFKPLGRPEIIGSLLDEADEKLSEANQKSLEKILKGAVEQVEAGALFKQLSDPDSQPESFEVRLEKAARELIKDDSKLTIEQAKVKAMHADPDLKKAYQEAKS